ncbi:MAG: TonB-dependent receptor [Thermodesulfobacteriota bacterium]|nr:TonB-dependent receptor [Thermodesulfobacteriota bacterium]
MTNMDENKKSLFSLGIIVLWILALMVGTLRAEEAPADNDDTLLMFVGEDLDVLSIASRREEGARQAPAVARVITRETLEEMGVRTLSQALETAPGFHMAQKEWGTQPYLRGIPDSVLFLYDTVPLGSDVSKSQHPLDHELSLAPVKRIEIIRGPGSVLWGPDAFAGILNVVPMTGKDLDGAETGVLYGGPGDQEAFFVNLGHDAGAWDAFLSVSGRYGEEDDTRCNLVSFWGDGETVVPPLYRFGGKWPGDARYFETSGRFSFRDWFTLSGRISDYRRPYAISRPEETITWRESRGGPAGFIKLEAKKAVDRSSAVRLTCSYSWLDPEYDIVDRTFEQEEHTSYGEIIYDRSFLAGRGLFTSGFSYRNKDIEDAPIWDSYLPDYLLPENRYFLPIVNQEDYDTTLWSLFGQYTHSIGDIDLWFGLRDDEHDEYRDHISYNAGFVWSLSSQWVLKGLYGTAYRTPFARQLLEEGEAELEKMRTFSVQIAWKPSNRAGLSLCGFASRIKNHIMEDPYAGLSLPNHQDIKGLELEGHVSPVKDLDLSANLTLIQNSGPDETYHYKYYFDGTSWHYRDLMYPYDTGPDTLFNLMGTWRPNEKLSGFLRLGYFSSRRLIYPRNEELEPYHSTSGVWLVDMSATVRDVVLSGLTLEFSIRNLTDKDYETPGVYSVIDGAPISAEVVLRKRW